MWTEGDTHWDAQEVDALVFVNTIHTDTRLEIGAIYTVANPGVEREGGIDCVMKRQCQGGGWLVVLAADNLAIVVQLVALGNAYGMLFCSTYTLHSCQLDIATPSSCPVELVEATDGSIKEWGRWTDALSAREGAMATVTAHLPEL